MATRRTDRLPDLRGIVPAGWLGGPQALQIRFTSAAVCLVLCASDCAADFSNRLQTACGALAEEEQCFYDLP